MGSAYRVRSAIRIATLIAAAAVGCATAGSAVGQEPPRLAAAIAAGRTDRALAVLAEQGDEQILFDPALVRGARSGPVAAGTPLPAALARVLDGTGLVARRVGPGVLVIEPAAPTQPSAIAEPAEDVVVTALRRPTLLRDTAVSLAVVPATRLAELRVTDQRSLSRALPELVATSTGPLQRRLAVRGISGTGEGTVGVYIGETPVSAPSGTGADPAAMAPDVELVDVERVELLKGPQGTLYGASSMGGTLRTIFRHADPAAPAGEAMVEGGLTAHGAPSRAASLMVNLPLVENRLAVRGVISRRRTGGVIDNRRLAYVDGDAVTRDGERLSLTWIPSPAVRVEALALAQRESAADGGLWYEGDGRFRADTAVRPRSSGSLRLASTTLHWAPPGVRVTATASHYRWDTVRELDFTNVIERQRGNAAACLRVAEAAGASGCDLAGFERYLSGRLPAVLHQPMRVRSTSGELRASNGGTGRWRWTVGAFAEHRADAVDSYTLRTDATTGGVVRPFDVTGLRLLGTRLDQQALFAEAEHDVGHGVTATAGARLYRYVRAGDGSVPIPNLLTGTGAIDRGARYRSEESGSNLKAALTWRATTGVIAHAVMSEGFRPGGVNITPELSADERVYRADHLWNYELGVKLPRQGVELAAFHVDWEDTIFAANSINGAFLYNTNLASVDVDGVEAGASRAVGPVRMAASATWLDARLAEDTLLGTSEGTGRRGDRLPTIPQIAFALSADMRLTLRGSVVVIGASLYGSGATRSTFNAGSAYHERTPPRATTDLFATLERRRWSVRLGIENLFDAVAATRVQSSAFGERQVYSLRPRTAVLSVANTF